MAHAAEGLVLLVDVGVHQDGVLRGAKLRLQLLLVLQPLQGIAALSHHLHSSPYRVIMCWQAQSPVLLQIITY